MLFLSHSITFSLLIHKPKEIGEAPSFSIDKFEDYMMNLLLKSHTSAKRCPHFEKRYGNDVA